MIKVNSRNYTKVRIKCNVEIKEKEVRGGGTSNSIVQADILCLVFLHAVERDLQAVNQNRIYPMVSSLTIPRLNVNIRLYFSFVCMSFFVFVFHVPSYSTAT